MSSERESSAVAATEGALVTVRAKYVETGSTSSVSSTPTNNRTSDKHHSLVYNDGQFSITLHHYDSIVGELKCPGCAQPMYGPIFLCTAGHSICTHCCRKVGMSSCPLCRNKMTDMRNYTLEAIAAKVQFPCTHAARGCTVRLPLELLWWHKDRCGFKQIECFMGKVWENCSWHGCEKDWNEHCVADHQDKVYNSPDIVLTWNYASDDRRGLQLQSVIAYYVIRTFGEFFNVYQILDQNSRRTIWTVICASKEAKTSQRFAFELELYSPIDSAKLLVQRFPCHAETDADFLKDGNCAKIAIEEAVRFMTKEKILYYRIRIVEVTPTRSRSLVLLSPTHQRHSSKRDSTPSSGFLPLDYSATQIENVNMKAVPQEDIIVRASSTPRLAPNQVTIRSDSSSSSSSSSNSSTVVDEEQQRQRDLPEEDQQLGGTPTSKGLTRANSIPKPPRTLTFQSDGEESTAEQKLVRCRILDRQESIKMKPIYSGTAATGELKKATPSSSSSVKASTESLNSAPAKGLSKFYNITTYRGAKLFNKKLFKQS
ncbi:seven in absentia [Culex quinquefasciatus]|uniref:RING-type E3 ubiquitin transferase n=1 Tax=Culex quinquefasciatus TaxID=7176 RepID=B0X888_CULQU|nr:seven in absentia [Culex quinquefasciatus]|eukprot:XP_001865860.1 seven in absentia [Culex quinquefasciatus]